MPPEQVAGTPPEFDEDGTRIPRDGTLVTNIVTSTKVISESWSSDDTGTYFFEVQSLGGFCLVVE